MAADDTPENFLIFCSLPEIFSQRSSQRRCVSTTKTPEMFQKHRGKIISSERSFKKKKKNRDAKRGTWN